MVSIAKCPRCHQFVSTPEGVDLDAMVKCPFCDAEYALRESLPPALIPVGAVPTAVEEGPATERPTPDAAAPATAETGTEAVEPAVAAPSVPESGTEAAEPAAEATAEPTAEGDATTPATPEPDEAKPTTAAAEDDGGMFDFLHQGPEASAPTEGAVDVGATVDPDLPSFADSDTPGDAGEGAPVSSLAARPRRRNEKSMAKEMIGAIVGGIVGLSIGYYALNLLGGERFDFLNIWLPGVSHTQKYWMSEQGGDEAGRNELDSAADSFAFSPTEPQETEPQPPEPASMARVEPLDELPPAALPEVEPEAEPEPLAPEYIGPRHRGSYSLSELGEALKTADAEFRDLQEHERLSDALYEELCRLAERLTFVDVEPDAPGLFDRQLAAASMFEDLALQPGRFDEVAARAKARLDDLDTADGGIVIAGTTGREFTRDGMHGAMLAVPGAPAGYNVLSDKPLGTDEGDSVLIAGVAVTHPSENLVGYPGTRPVAIWTGLAVRLPKPFDDLDELP